MNKWAEGPFFIFVVIKMRQDLRTLRPMIAAVVEAMNYELVGIEFHPHRANALLRVYIDSEKGITIDDCQRVSHQLGGVLEVEDPVAGRYSLEISSPGLERPLFEAQHFIRFTGSEVRLQFTELVDGRRKLIGQLLGMRDNDVVIIDSEGREWRVPLERIEKARLIPEL